VFSEVPLSVLWQATPRRSWPMPEVVRVGVRSVAMTRCYLDYDRLLLQTVALESPVRFHVRNEVTVWKRPMIRHDLPEE
jgi:hypothetical protein